MADLTRYTQRPLDLFAQMRREMDEVFGHWLGRASAPSLLANWPSTSQLFTPCELQETDNEYVARFDLPGLTDKDIKVSFQGDVLTITGERKDHKTEGKGQTRYTERSYGAFTRTIAIPSPVKSEEIRARYANGVMEVQLPKAQKTTTREIKIEHTP
jgi:HSP20 family protein